MEARLLAATDTLRNWAFGALDMAEADSFARNVVAREVSAAGEGVNALQLAYLTNAKQFLTHWASEELIDRQWRSGSSRGFTIELPTNFSWPLLLLTALFPPCNIYLWQRPPEPDEAPNYVGPIFFRALRRANQIHHEERTKMIARTKARGQRRLSEMMEEEPAGATLKAHLEGAEQAHAEHNSAVRNAKQASEEQRSSVHILTRTSAFYAIPAVRFAITGVVHATYLGFTVMIILDYHNEVLPSDPKAFAEPGLSIYDKGTFVWFLWGALIMLSELDKYLAKDEFRWDPSGAEKDEFDLMTKSSNLMTLISLVLRVVREYAQGDLRSGINHGFSVIVALNATFMSTMMLRYVSVYRPLGVLIITVSQMMIDILNYSALNAAVTCGFTIALIGFQQIGRFEVNGVTNDDYGHVRGAAWETFWSIFGSFQSDAYDWLVSIVMFVYMVTAATGSMPPPHV